MSIELPTLYDHQVELKDATKAALIRHRRVILCAPPGVGKTRTSKWILASSATKEPSDKQTGRTLFAVHRRGLVDNASNSFWEDPPLSHGLIMSGRKPNWLKRVQVASIDTLLSWLVNGKEYESEYTFDLIVFDESHSHLPKLVKFLQAHDAKREELGLAQSYVIGLTATPQATGLADVYGEIVQGPSTQWLIDNEFLSGFRYFRATQGQLGLLVRRGGQFTKDSEAKAMDGLAGDLVRDWKRHAEGRPTVGFFPRRSHAREAMAELQQAGLRVEYVDGDTGDETRRQIFKDLNEHNIDYLCNVQVVERGTDIPRIGCVQLAVAIGSLVRYRQMIGRGSRRHPAKSDCMILDHGGNVIRHGFFEDDPHWSLDVTTSDAGEQKPRKQIECPKCQAIYRGGLCKACGYEPKKAERDAQGLEWDGTELKEVTREETKPALAPEELMIKALFIAGKRNMYWRSCAKMFVKMSIQQNTKYKVPNRIQVGNHTYRMPTYGSRDNGRLVKHLFPFTTQRGNHGGAYLVE